MSSSIDIEVAVAIDMMGLRLGRFIILCYFDAEEKHMYTNNNTSNCVNTTMGLRLLQE